ncbi:hypothetical protein AAHA92_26183 [Salvia divinorum]|uniref:Ig-like domain-containing protein n=1 Tax=Salvia divinorum TaxID=28513 RepID=A0ABD1GG66_SALDI
MKELITSVREGDEVTMTCLLVGWRIEWKVWADADLNGSPSRHRWSGTHSFKLLSSAQNATAVSTPVLSRGVFDFCRYGLPFLSDSFKFENLIYLEWWKINGKHSALKKSLHSLIFVGRRISAESRICYFSAL